MLYIFIISIILYLILRGIFIYLGYHGRKTPENEKLVLKYFSPDDIKKGIDYHRRGFSISIIWKIIDFVFPLAFFISGLSIFFSSSFQEITANRFSIQVILYIITYSMIQLIINLPLAYYFAYILEHKFGFSNMTLKSWIFYTFKKYIIGLVISIVIGSAVYYIFRRTNFHWVWIIPCFILIFELFITLIYPYAILPMFYKKSNFGDNEYTKPIIEIAQKCGIKLKKLYQINESKYSKHTNAFFTGFGPEKSIYIFDTLVKNNTPAQVASVVAHEAGHWKHHHVLKGIMTGFLGSLLITILLYYTYPTVINTNKTPLSDIAGLPILLFIINIYSFFLNPIQNFISRKFEITADTYELKSTREKDTFISSMVQLAKDNHAFLYPHPFSNFWNATHPSILERIKMAEEFKE
ncbi:MAG: M48 family metallopeptidase [Candidatus Firestonebacteria bacterium]